MSRPALTPVNLPALSSAPTIPTLRAGDVYYNTTSGLQVYNGTSWSAVSTSSGSAITEWRYTATGGETTLSGTDGFSTTLSYTVNNEMVYINGVLLERGVDYTATNGTSITGLTALTINDIATVISFSVTSIANAVPLSTATAKGDLIVGTGASTVTTQSVGADGTYLIANSGVTSGVSYAQNFSAGKNKFHNSDFATWQRGTSFAFTGSAYTADRWIVAANSTGSTTTQSTFTPGTAPVAGYEGTYYLTYAKNDTSTNTLAIRQRIEDVRTLAGQVCTLSFWAYASSSFTNEPLLRSSYGSGGSADAYSFPATGASSFTIGTSWQRYSISFTMPSTTGKTIGAGSCTEVYVIRSSSNPNVTVNLWGPQLEAGSVATAFSTATGNQAQELETCMRFYEVSNSLFVPATSGGFASNAYCGGNWIVPKRATPTVNFINNSGGGAGATLYYGATGYNSTSTAMTVTTQGFGGYFANSSWGTNANGNLLIFTYNASADL